MINRSKTEKILFAATTIFVIAVWAFIYFGGL